jgi:hypothetical protein
MNAEESMTSKQAREGDQVTKEYEFDLSVEEIRVKAERAAELSADVRAKRAEAEEYRKAQQNIMKAMDAEVENLEQELHQTLALVKAKKERRAEMVVMVKNFEKKTVEFYHGDLLMESRTMTAEELQADLPLEKPKKRSKELTGAQKTYSGVPKESELPPEHREALETQDVIRQETSKRTKLSAVDGIYSNGPTSL